MLSKFDPIHKFQACPRHTNDSAGSSQVEVSEASKWELAYPVSGEPENPCMALAIKKVTLTIVRTLEVVFNPSNLLLWAQRAKFKMGEVTDSQDCSPDLQ